MNWIEKTLTGISAVALMTAFASPALAEKTVIADEDLDEVTAAGQPKIAQASTYHGTAAAVNFQVNVFAGHIDGQSELTALTLNNIFGENQIANGVNIQSAHSATGSNSGSQSNNASQSWGSAKAWGSVVVKGKKGGAAENKGCVGLIVKCNATGGDASQGKIGLMWAFADEIADATVGGGYDRHGYRHDRHGKDGMVTAVCVDGCDENDHDHDAIAANVVVTIVAGAFAETGQTNLTALTVNNVFGFNQVANGTNISSGDIGGGIIDHAGGGTSTLQSNTSDQWRGAAKSWNLAPTFSGL